MLLSIIGEASRRNLAASGHSDIADRTRVTRARPRVARRTALGPYTSAGQRLDEKRQALVHSVIDPAMVVGELLVAMRNAELVQPPHEPAGTVEQIELILLAAIDVERLQPAEIIRLDFDRNYRVRRQIARPLVSALPAAATAFGARHCERRRPASAGSLFCHSACAEQQCRMPVCLMMATRISP
jgi:hypothetical protein